jgi:hypothetical protein
MLLGAALLSDKLRDNHATHGDERGAQRYSSLHFYLLTRHCRHQTGYRLSSPEWASTGVRDSKVLN